MSLVDWIFTAVVAAGAVLLAVAMVAERRDMNRESARHSGYSRPDSAGNVHCVCHGEYITNIDDSDPVGYRDIR